MVRTAVVDFAKDRDRLDSRQNWKRRDGACRSNRPYRMEAGELRRKARFDAFADTQSKHHDFVGIEFDRGVPDATKHFAIELARVAIQNGSVEAARLIRCDIAKERKHRANKNAVKFQRGMKPNYIAGNTIGEKETA
jgi:hypothetical protein